jgi:CheY-like chemotaxis protein
MSYPRLIQPLIIEDDPPELYHVVFESLVSSGERLATPIHAYSHEAALRELKSDRIFHLVLLDLRLPDISDHPAQEGINHGLNLLQECSTRDSFPIPVLMVISGHLEQAEQLELQRKVTDNFFYGKVLVKSPQVGSAIILAVNEVKKYLGAGIHIRDTERETYPTLGPRDEDLLRRCLLRQNNCTGVDLKWWSAEYGRATGSFAAHTGWTKTLTGRLLFADDGSSRLCFFKFAPTTGADTVIGDAKMMGHKLAHIKVLDALVSTNRSLLITQKVGTSDEDPISLATYLSRPPIEIVHSLPTIVKDIADQVRALGDVTEDRRFMRELLWPEHGRYQLKVEWERNEGHAIVDDLGEAADPISLYDELNSEETLVTFKRQSFRHGDLNVTNVAIDLGDGEPAAYIFDASGCAPGPSVRDLAMLEVTSLLHHPGTRAESLVRSCAGLYSPTESNVFNLDHGSDLARNTYRLISEIRAKAFKQEDPYLYVLMVFDSALIQLGGLAFGHSCNKIANPKDAALLAAYSARWLRAMIEDSGRRRTFHLRLTDERI